MSGGFRRLAKFLSFTFRRRGCIVAVTGEVQAHSLVADARVYSLEYDVVGWLERKRSPLDPVMPIASGAHCANVPV